MDQKTTRLLERLGGKVIDALGSIRDELRQANRQRDRWATETLAVLREAKPGPEDRLQRIADAHVRPVLNGGLVDDYCGECHLRWPCPTHVWATTERDPLAPWHPGDDHA